MSERAHVGRTSASTRHERERRSLTLASYNIHRCVGTDRRYDPDRIAAVLRELKADVIGLQEVDSRYHRKGGIDQLDYLSRATGMLAFEGATLRGDHGRYGNALLTTQNVDLVKHIDLSVPGREPRAALDVRLNLGFKILRLIATHLGLRFHERVVQVTRLLDSIGTQNPEELLVLMGDFNEWRPRTVVLQRLTRRLGTAPTKRTFPSWHPLLALDRIWVQPNSALRKFDVHCTNLARVASDHLPVRAVIHQDF